MSMQKILMMAGVTAGVIFGVNVLANQPGIFRTVFRGQNQGGGNGG